MSEKADVYSELTQVVNGFTPEVFDTLKKELISGIVTNTPKEKAEDPIIKAVIAAMAKHGLLKLDTTYAQASPFVLTSLDAFDELKANEMWNRKAQIEERTDPRALAKDSPNSTTK